MDPKKLHHNDRVNFASMNLNLQGVQLEITWSTGLRRPNSLEIRASHLKSLGENWGGLLGNDDHTFVSTYDPRCKKNFDYHNHEQLSKKTPSKEHNSTSMVG